MKEKISGEKTRAERFLDAFNSIDYSLRVRYGLNRSMSFSDLIRKSVVLNYIVRKYEDDLIDYSRLRNAIVHQGNMDKIIAEPHQDVVDRIEKIDRLINTPPKALDTVSRRDVLTVDAAETIDNVVRLIASSGYSNIPITDNGGIIGIANGQKILNVLGLELINGKPASEFLKEPIINVLSALYSSVYYVIRDENITVEDALKIFHDNSKMLAILVTKTGNEKEKPLGIITGADIMKMNKILEDY